MFKPRMGEEASLYDIYKDCGDYRGNLEKLKIL